MAPMDPREVLNFFSEHPPAPEFFLGAFSIMIILVRRGFLLSKEIQKLKSELADFAVLERTLKAGVVLDGSESWKDMDSWERERVE